jgi:hypothetical protein
MLSSFPRSKIRRTSSRRRHWGSISEQLPRQPFSTAKSAPTKARVIRRERVAPRRAKIVWPSYPACVGGSGASTRVTRVPRPRGRNQHDKLFCKDRGEPIRNLNDPYDRRRGTLRRTEQARYREPCAARHSSVSWNLMTGKDLLWVAKQHGQSMQMMLNTYAAWTEGANESDIDAIKGAMQACPRSVARTMRTTACIPVQSPRFGADFTFAPRQNCVSDRRRLEMSGAKGETRMHGAC